MNNEALAKTVGKSRSFSESVILLQSHLQCQPLVQELLLFFGFPRTAQQVSSDFALVTEIRLTASPRSCCFFLILCQVEVSCAQVKICFFSSLCYLVTVN